MPCLTTEEELFCGFPNLMLFFSELANLVTLAIEYLNDTKIIVTNITADNAQSNITMFSLLGAKLNDAENLKVTLDLVNALGEPICVIQDVSHLMKIVRNAFGELSIFYLPDGSKILWSHIVSLQNLQWEKGLHLANKLTKDHINFHKKKMKVYLATQVLSNSVADSLQFCAETLEDDEFKETEATCQFLRIFNMIFDILDSNHRFCLKKQAMKVENKENWTKEFKKTENFIKSLHMFDPTCEPQTKKKKPLKKLVVEGPRKRGFLGFLVNMDSFKAMFETYVEKKKILEYICGHKSRWSDPALFRN